MSDISDPFILELQEVFGVTGFTGKKNGKYFTVGQPTQPIIETKRDRRIRWKLFYKRGV